MMAYSGGDEFPCVVGEVGSYATKFGFAGEDYPRSYFRSTTAILRDYSSSSSSSSSSTNTPSSKSPSSGSTGFTSASPSSPRKFSSSSGRCKFKRSYDFFHRSLEPVDGDVEDGAWEVCNPTDRTTGLIYQGLGMSAGSFVPSSMNANPAHSPPSSSSSTSNNKNDHNKQPQDDPKDVEMKDASSTPQQPQSHPPSSTSTVPIQDPTLPGECYTHFSSHISHAYTSALCISPSSAPLLLIEKAYNPPPIRQKLMEVLFEEHAIPAAFLAKDAVCACYAVGKTSGIVADVGHSGTTVTPVYEGFVETKGILRSPVGTAMMGEMVLQTLDGLYRTKKARMKLKHSDAEYVMPLYQVRSGGPAAAGRRGTTMTTRRHDSRREPFHTLARLDMARLCIEEGTGAGVGIYGYAALQDLEGEEARAIAAGEQEPSDIYQQYRNAPKATYKLPDGTTVDVSQTKRFDVAELMFGKGGRSAKMRMEAVEDARRRMDALIASSGGGGGGDGEDAGGDEGDEGGTTSAGANGEPSAIAKLEARMQRRRRHGGVSSSSSSSPSHNHNHNNKANKITSYAAHEKLVRACTPYLSTALGELTSSTLPSMICDSAFRCDRDQQAQLLGNAILCGGGACLGTSVLSNSAGVNNGNSMPERIRQECEAIIHAHTPGWRVKVSSPGLAERSICSWLGGSILGSLGSFHDMWITKADYEEYGAAIVNRKCP